MRLQAYVELRQAAAGGTDGLIDVFESAAATFAATASAAQSGATVLEAACAAFADLTSRDLATVQAAAQQLGFGTRSQVDTSGLHVTAPDFASERGLGRLWQVLGLANRIGVSIDALAGVTGLVDTSKSEDDRATLATDFKNAVKAHYTVDAWRPIAQSIFDPLRQRKRDALSAWLVGNLGFTSTNQLFEYFLVDPGMEPVVQTSRIRLALSSVQTFVQRCLLNLESQVDPSAIPANQWEWMKRYRVWQANREIFLWPENWMEPEWRTDKTDLFQTLESALLQGDVTNELVEDALLAYLRELDVRARLQIVSMYMEEVPGDPAANKLHVLARTWGTPHKYYYRYRQFGLWSAWDPVKADIAGDHVAIIKWRERLHLFWVTFAQVARQGQTPADGSNPQPVGQMSFGTVSDKMDASAAQKQMQLQLGWSELVSGKWSAAKATDLSRTPAIDVNSNYEPRQTYIHAAIEYDEQGNEGAVKIILDSDIFAEFRLVNKNADPVLSNAWEAPETVPFSATEYDATQVRGSGSLIVWFAQQVTTKLGGGTSYDVTPTPILAQGNDWELVVCDTPVTPIAEQEDGDKYYGTPAEVKNLSMPFFYQDLEQHATLFVQPHVDETSSFIWWPGWVLEPPPIDLRLMGQDWWNQLNLSAQVPSVEPVNPPDPDAVFKLDRGSDWLANDVATISFGGVAIGKAGGVAAASAGADVRARLAMGSGS